MSKEDEQIELIKKFIFDDNLQKELSEINNNLMAFNILEITGMGHQEIKHSTILGWLFDDSEHNLEYKILDEFLKKVVLKNENNEKIETLKEYIYLSHKQDLNIYREKDNIDLLVVDENNKVVITIENKVFATERKDGKDGGQLQKYKDILDKKYNDDYQKYFIFLTINLEGPSKGNKNWMIANHQMITDTIEEIIKNNQDLSIKAKIIFESYVDLLKRKKIVENKNIKELCEKVWNEPSYKQALEVLFNYKPNQSELILKSIEKNENVDEVITKINGATHNYFIKFKHTELLLRLTYNEKEGLGFVIMSEKKEIGNQFEKYTIYNEVLKKIEKEGSQYGYHFVSNFAWYAIKEDIDEALIEKLLYDFINESNKRP